MRNYKSCKSCKHGEEVEEYCEHDELVGCSTEYWSYWDCQHPNEKISEILNDDCEPLINNCKHWMKK